MKKSYVPYNKIIFTNEQIEDIISDYKNQGTSVSIAKRYGVNHHVILKLLHQYGVEVSQSKKVRKYALDEHYFDNIDCQNKAYILGFLYADGSNNPSKGTISLSLQEEDGYILDKIRQELHSEKPLEYLDYSNKHDFGYTYKNQYRLLLFSSYLCKRLDGLGMMRNKSLQLTFPDFLPVKLIPHFVRGVYDGDGSIYQFYINDNNIPVTVTITSTANFCESLKCICQDLLNINPGIYDASCHNGITKVFTLSGRNITKVFLDWIYADAELFLQRKYDRYLSYYNINNSLLV